MFQRMLIRFNRAGQQNLCSLIFFKSFSRQRHKKTLNNILWRLSGLSCFSMCNIKKCRLFLFLLSSYNCNACTKYIRVATFDCQHPVTVLLTTKETQIGAFRSVPQHRQRLSQELIRILFALFQCSLMCFEPSAGTSQHVRCPPFTLFF